MWLSVETIKMNTDSKPISMFAERHMKKAFCISAMHVINTENQLSLSNNLGNSFIIIVKGIMTLW